jgi:frataxin
VVTAKLGSKGTYVVNKQTPSRQLWLSSPFSGPWHYDFDGSTWRCTKDGHAMAERLRGELRQHFGRDVDVDGSSA